MGLDGGTKITRSDVLRGQSWRMTQADGSRSTRGGCVNQTFQEKQLDPQTRRAVLWSCCALSGLPLVAPIVADLAGQLYNRQAVLEHLLAAKGGQVGDQEAQLRYSNQQRAGGLFDHITSLKDVFTLHLTPNPQLQQQRQQHECGLAAAGSSSTAAASVQQPVQSSSSTCGTGSMDVPPWVCPVTLLPCGGKQPFSALKRCGHVLSDKAFAAVTAAEHSCSVCGAAFSSKDVVQINGSQEHLDTMRQQLRAKAAAKAAAKKAKVAEQLGVPSKRAHELTGPDSSTHATAIADSGKKQRMLEGRLQAAEVALMERQQA